MLRHPNLFTRPAIAALAGAAALIVPIAGTQAATIRHHHHHVAAQTAAEARETIETRIEMLHTQLAITPGEETQWTAVAQAMRDNETEMQKMLTEHRAMAPNGDTAVDELKTYARFSQAHVDGLKNLISSFETLYAAMPAPQQAVADQVFIKFGHHLSASKS
jgi:hypothetical protein